MKKTILYLLISVNYFNFSFSQEKKATKDLKKDLEIIRDITLQLSTKLTKEDKINLNNFFEVKASELKKDSLTIIDFFNFIFDSKINSKFDEHAAFNIPEDVMMPFLKNNTIFPIPIKVINKKLIVNSKKTSIPYGSIIESINDVNISDLYKRLMREGEHETYDYKMFESQFSLVYLLRIGNPNQFKITYRKSLNDSQILKTTIDGIKIEDYLNVMNNERIYPLHRKELRNQINTNYFTDSNTYYLQFNSFNWIESETENSYLEFNKLLDSTFNDIKHKKTENLIIYLRFNSGGNIEIPALLYSYIAKSPFIDNVIGKINHFNFPHTEHIIAASEVVIDENNTLPGFIEYIKQGAEKIGDQYIIKYIDNKTINPKENAFKGNVYLLIGGNTISASAYFSSQFKLNQRGEIIGEQIGGSHHEITAGYSLEYKLPTSNLTMTIPILVLSLSDEVYKKVPEKKITPNVTLSEKTRYNYFIKEEDPEIMETLKIINKK